MNKQIWIGEFEFFECGVLGLHSFALCLVNRIHEVKHASEDDIKKVDDEGLDWIVPSEYRGEIAFSQSFMRNLGGNLKQFEEV
jgi:hypothetical protein